MLQNCTTSFKKIGHMPRNPHKEKQLKRRFTTISPANMQDISTVYQQAPFVE
jgi:hypothetical protein